MTTLSSSSPWPLASPSPSPNPNPTFLSFSSSPHMAESSPPPSSPPHHQTTQTPTTHHDPEEEEEEETLSELTDSSSLPSFTQNPNSNPTHLPTSTSVPALLHLSFNQDYGCFAVGTDHGFRIYNCDPYREIFRRDFDTATGGGVGVVEMLFRCNILALVGGGPDPQYPINKVMIWDDHQSRCIGELSFRSEVKAVRLRRDRIIVILVQKIFVYNFADLKLLHQIETIANPKGLCEVSHVSGSLVLVCPGLQKGQVRVEHYGSKRTKFIMAHDSRIACFALTQDGRLLATASSKGTLVRIYNTLDGSLLQENVDSVFGKICGFEIAGVLPRYFSSEWSVAQFRLHEGSHYIVAFGHQKNTVVILGMDGSFYRCQFDPVSGGEMTQLEYYNFLKPEETF
ncbi:hypothetical protein L1049_020263 [Liquidambar formosana]|uniref:Autophagy-related protein 18a n=1 Tax=Liquidambar formosana TaxID=63359 RepID=A0AAP0X3I9_LIQFO